MKMNVFNGWSTERRFADRLVKMDAVTQPCDHVTIQHRPLSVRAYLEKGFLMVIEVDAQGERDDRGILSAAHSISEDLLDLSSNVYNVNVGI